MEQEKNAVLPDRIKKIRRSHWLWLSLLIVSLDWWTKTVASQWLYYAVPIPVLPILDWTLLHNSGAAFSFLSSGSGWQRWLFITITSIVIVGLLIWLYRLPTNKPWIAAALALILGGALGNLYDRVCFGYVIDFISLHYQNWYFPAFNIADMAISIGTLILIMDILFTRKQTTDER